MPDSSSTPVRVAVVGAGHVGASYAYALLFSGVAAEIVLVDKNRAKAEGEAMDLSHSEPFARPTRIFAGGYEDCAGAAITMVAAGVNQQPGEGRMDVLKRNAAVFREVIPQIARYNPSGILLVSTNPVDVLTYAATRLSGLPPHRVIGSGTMLDTARFRSLLSRYFKVDSRSVHAFIIGEHGDSEVPVWSLANIAGMRLPDFCRAHGLDCDPLAMDHLFHQTRDAAQEIIRRKGATHFAVAAGLMRITQAILRNQNTVLSVSSLVEDYLGIRDVCLSLPTVLSREGVERVLRLELAPDEIAGLRHSAALLHETTRSLDLG